MLLLWLVEVVLVQDEGVGEHIAEEAGERGLAAGRGAADAHDDGLSVFRRGAHVGAELCVEDLEGRFNPPYLGSCGALGAEVCTHFRGVKVGVEDKMGYLEVRFD